ncbi:FecR family protein [Chitinophaga sp. YR573]|uniref:FecR family protein n=1 Tax=Chitinophaga sp. YR573 TaxID=1881040 RepID=UPI0008AF1576|nr:FecR family protein [Chitinophaga sp. YR573]SEW43332.1 FecR family protein [Chitinophaga sp. YR573]
MNEEQAKHLLARYRQGLCSEEENQAIEAWIAEEQRLYTWDKTDHERVLFGISLKKRIDAKRDKPIRRLNNSWLRAAIAASVILLLSAGFYLFNNSHTTPRIATNVITPGSDKAILTLGNGRQILLDSIKNGVIADDNNATIQKTMGGTIVYSGKGGTSWNTISVPRGGQYAIILSDGSKVMLNAASSLKYPATFIGKERSVELTGEAYFEVVHNKAQPFKVVSNGQEVAVLGTHFNINAYTDEDNTKTTLLEGSVKVSNATGYKIITPGEQTILQNKSFIIRVVNAEQEVAWKDGYFRFNNEKIESIMRKLSRWYNIDVKYSGRVPVENFYGKISRYKNIDEVLSILENTNSVHFKIEGRAVIVME